MISFRNTAKKVPFIRALYRGFRYLTGYGGFIRDFLAFRRQSERLGTRFPLAWGERNPCLLDRTGTTTYDRHYILHLAWAARVLAEIRPTVHVDISSQLQFCTMISAFVPIRFYDYRPADLPLDGLTSEAADLMALPFGDGSMLSLSCMHVVEHIGLGRYGDPIDPDGDLKAISELIRVLAPGGDLLFAVPIGCAKIVFNAHRIFSYDQILDYFSGLELREFALVPEHAETGGLIRNASREQADQESYGCGCFWFRKPVGVDAIASK